jgi:hypothetical protein
MWKTTARPVAQQPRLDVLERQRLAQQRVVEQVDCCVMASLARGSRTASTEGRERRCHRLLAAFVGFVRG